jgi:hypothetical protein
MMLYVYFRLPFEIAEERLYWWRGRIQIWKKLTSWVKRGAELYGSSDAIRSASESQQLIMVRLTK